MTELAIELGRLSAPSLAASPGRVIAPPFSSSVPCAASQRVVVPPKPRRRSLVAFGAVLALLSLASLWHLRSAELPPEASSRSPATAPSPVVAAQLPPVTAPAAPLPEPLTVVELGPGKVVEIEARTRLSLRLDGAEAPPQPALAAPKPRPKPIEAARRARPKPITVPAPPEPPEAEPGAEAADEFVRPWPVKP